jgi:hypothetical protein
MPTRCPGPAARPRPHATASAAAGAARDVTFQLHQQPFDHLPAGLPGLPPREAPGDPPHQVREQRGADITGCRGSSDGRVLVVSRNCRRHDERGRHPVRRLSSIVCLGPAWPGQLR